MPLTTARARSAERKANVKKGRSQLPFSMRKQSEISLLYKQALENRNPEFQRKVKDAGIKKRKPAKQNPLDRFTCPACPKVFKRYDHLIRHIRTRTEEHHIRLAVTMNEKLPAKHQPVERITCPACERVFNRDDHLYRHIRDSTDESHTRLAVKVNENYCAECDRTFKRKEGFTRHQRIHAESSARLEKVLNGSGSPSPPLSPSGNRSPGIQQAACQPGNPLHATDTIPYTPQLFDLETLRQQDCAAFLAFSAAPGDIDLALFDMALEAAKCSDQDYGLAFSAAPGDVDRADQNYLAFSAAPGDINQPLSAVALGDPALIGCGYVVV